MNLRDYQQKAIEEVIAGIEEHPRTVLSAPTGAGKTEMAVALARWAKEQGRRAWFIVDRKTLSHQARERFERYGLIVSVMQGDNTMMRAASDVVVATVQTMRARMLTEDGLNLLGFDAGLILLDEVHVFHQFHREILKASDAPAVGLSATPHNPALGLYFSRLVVPVTVQELIEQEHLVPFKVYAPSAPDLTGVRVERGEFAERDLDGVMAALHGDIVSHWQEHARRRPTIAFCVNVKHAHELAGEFESAGVTAAVVTGKTPDEDRDEVYAKLRSGAVQVCCTVMVLSVGFDLPEASCAILARPTASEALHIQQCGRVARVAVNKDSALILDHAGNTLRHGLPQNYNPPELDEVETRTRTQRNPKEPKAISCPECGFGMEPWEQTCAACGASTAVVSEVVTLPGQLQEIDGPPPVDQRDRRQVFSECLGYYTGKPFARGKENGFAVGLYEFIFGAVPWEDPLFSGSHKTLSPDTPSTEVERAADNKWKHYLAHKRGIQKREEREADTELQSIIAALPEWNQTSFTLERWDCDHRWTGVYRAAPPHVAKRMCKVCGMHMQFVAAESLKESA